MHTYERTYIYTYIHKLTDKHITLLCVVQSDKNGQVEVYNPTYSVKNKDYTPVSLLYFVYKIYINNVYLNVFPLC